MKNFKLLFAFLVVSSLALATESTTTDEQVDQKQVTESTTAKNKSSYISSVTNALTKFAKDTNSYVESWDNAVHTALKPNANPTTYLTQAQNCITLPFRRPVTTLISAIVLYAAYAAYQEYNQDEQVEADEKN